ncbi:TLC domain-containing protein, partial [Paraphysoderma sedebokerense]
DVNFTLFYVLVVLLIRELSMRYIFRPLATFHNIRSSAMITRFQEQAWLAVYYTTFFSLGFYLAYNSPYFTNFTLFWVNYPHKTYSGLFKSYYLLQLSFSIAQLVVLHIEKPRKDYVQYLVHHIVTICLVAGSYAMNYTRIGNMIFIVMDVADIFLSSAKCLKYLGYTNACDVQFGLFVLVWFLSRHIAYPLVVSSIPFDLYGWSLPWEAQSKQPIKMNYDPSNGAYLSDNVISGFVVLFAGLKGLILYWGYLIARIVVKVVKGKGGAEDTRSDDESD